MQYQQEKFVNALLFFGRKTNPKVFGITKLLKLLFLSDFRHFQKYGRPILGDIYFRLPQGPVPSISYNLFNDTFQIGQDTDLKKVARIVQEKVGDFNLNRIEVLEDPNMSVFSESDVDIMEDIAKKFYGKTGTEMVKSLHKIPLVRNVAEGTEIDYKLVLKKNGDRAYAEVLEKEDEELAEALGSL